MQNYHSFIKTLLVAIIAVFFMLVAVDNVIDYQSNWVFVQHVLSMDTTFKSPTLMWRSITNPTIQTFAYWFIILWEFVVAIFCWLGTFKILKHEKKFAVLGLSMGIFLYLLVFVVIGGEWFASWQSAQFNGQNKAGLFSTLLLLILIYINQKEI